MKLPSRRVNFEVVTIAIFVTCVISYYVMTARKKTVLLWMVGSVHESHSTVVNDKWIVVTSISWPSEDVVKLAAIDGWQLLVVADSRTPKNWSCPGALYLGLDEQKELPYGIIRSIPYNAYTRKNIGYMYAIDHGARYIYDTDDDNHPVNGKINFQLKPVTTGLVYQDTRYNVTNPYFHFGQPTIWPRGYPLEAINNPINNTYTLCTFRTPTIQQGLVNKDPDVDAVFRLTRKKGPGAEFNITFDSRAPPLVLPDGVFAPFNSQNTLFAYDAFWALLLPTSVSFRVTDIWRGYWAQRLMWLLGQKLAFYPPNAIQIRNPHEYLKDFNEENQVYSESGLLIAFLEKWQCPRKKSFFECAVLLSRDMVEAKFWGREDAWLIESWFADLKSIGYTEPVLKPNRYDEPCDVTTGNKRTVYFSPVSKTEVPQATVDSEKLDTNGQPGLAELCRGLLNQTLYETNAKNLTDVVYDNVLLVIVFNSPFHRVIPVLENLYHRHFPNTVYCGEATGYQDILAEIHAREPSSSSSSSKGLRLKWKRRALSFIKIKANRGYFGYECAMRAMEMNYGVDGYLVVGDDVLVNVWNLRNMNFSQSASEVGPYSQSRYLSLKKTGWMWWKTAMGYNATNNALDELNKLCTKGPTSSSHHGGSRLLDEYFQNLLLKSLNETISINLSDIYYVPGSKRELFLRVANVFYRHEVFLEIAVPTIIEGLHSFKTQSLPGKSLWGGDRGRWNNFYSTQDVYLHPVKLSEVFKNEDAKMRYCQYYVSNFINEIN